MCKSTSHLDVKPVRENFCCCYCWTVGEVEVWIHLHFTHHWLDSALYLTGCTHVKVHTDIFDRNAHAQEGLWPHSRGVWYGGNSSLWLDLSWLCWPCSSSVFWKLKQMKQGKQFKRELEQAEHFISHFAEDGRRGHAAYNLLKSNRHFARLWPPSTFWQMT